MEGIKVCKLGYVECRMWMQAIGRYRGAGEIGKVPMSWRRVKAYFKLIPQET